MILTRKIADVKIVQVQRASKSDSKDKKSSRHNPIHENSYLS